MLTEQEFALALHYLGRSAAVIDARRSLAKRLGREVSEREFRHAFQGHGSPSTHLGQRSEAIDPAPSAPPAPVDPVARADAQSAQARLRSEHAKLLDEVRESRARHAFYSALEAAPRTLTIERAERTDSSAREMCAVILGSDWHVEETVHAVKVQGRNSFNLEIADMRVDRFFRGIIDLVQHHRASAKVVIRDIVLALMGDLMTGYIHEELAESNALSPVETVLWLLPRLRSGLRLVADELDLRSVKVPWCYGNHGRTTQRSRISTGAENSFEWMLGVHLANEFADDSRFEFDVSPAAHQYVHVYDFDLHFHHGDSLKYQGGVGGLGIPLLKAIAAWDEVRRAHYHHVGHWHQLRDYGRALVNGSIIGYGPYSAWIRAPFEDPAQLLYLLDSKRGKCHSTPIWVSPRNGEASKKK